MSIGRDRGLQVRMALTALLIVALYVLIITLLLAARVGAVAISVLVAVLVLAHYLGTDRIILAALGARPADPGRMPELHAAMERVCGLADRAAVDLAVIESSVPNAFTVARSPLNATVCLTRGLLELLDEAQLEAVLAHELAHVASRNVVLITLGSLWAALAAQLLALDIRRLPHRAGREPRPWLPVALLAGLLYVVSYVVIQPLARHRQLAADRAAFLLGGSVALDAALRRISQVGEQLDEPAREGVCGELTALGLVAVDAPVTVATLFPTHPPLALRLAQLSRGAEELFAPA
jgi:heat shock protein HtpX